jgi:hypothetical protein
VTEWVAPFGETILRLQAGQDIDPYSGEPVSAQDWVNPTATEVHGCVLYPSGMVGAEQVDVGRPEIAQQTLTVLLPPGVELDPSDRVQYRGNMFDVVGFTFQFVNPFTGWAPGGQATIRRRQG